MAVVDPGGAIANVNCAYSDVPSQIQAATGTEGAINCAGGASGNTTTSPLTSLFSRRDRIRAASRIPGHRQRSRVRDLLAVRNSTVGDRPGRQSKVVDGNGDCTAVQDMGALELQGHSAACPKPPAPPAAKPVAGTITGLTVAPNSFYAASSGATISKASKKAKKTYGANVTYKDSQAAHDHIHRARRDVRSHTGQIVQEAKQIENRSSSILRP